MAVALVNVIRKLHTVDKFIATYGTDKALVLNLGSSTARPVPHCINVDIQRKPGINLVGDAHHLPFRALTFDIVILSAVLQYCREPHRVAAETYRVLKQGGYVYVDAPFVQPYCPDTADLYRFTRDGLVAIFGSMFSVLQCEVSIPGGSALAFYCQRLVGNSSSKYVNFLVKTLVSYALMPVSLLHYNRHADVAGAFYLIGRKNGSAADAVRSRSG